MSSILKLSDGRTVRVREDANIALDKLVPGRGYATFTNALDGRDRYIFIAHVTEVQRP